MWSRCLRGSTSCYRGATDIAGLPLAARSVFYFGSSELVWGWYVSPTAPCILTSSMKPRSLEENGGKLCNSSLSHRFKDFLRTICLSPAINHNWTDVLWFHSSLMYNYPFFLMLFCISAVFSFRRRSMTKMLLPYNMNKYKTMKLIEVSQLKLISSLLIPN